MAKSNFNTPEVRTFPVIPKLEDNATVHLSLVIALMIIFPYSKLLHAPGLFFSPTRNQVDNARSKRHVASWAKKMESSK
jgi:nitrate reductase gamma subunit